MDPHTLLLTMRDMFNDFFVQDNFQICDNVETIQYTSNSPTFYFGKNNICGRHLETEFGAKKFFKAYDGQLKLEIIPGEYSEATKNMIDFVYTFTSKEAKALTVNDFMDCLFDAMNDQLGTEKRWELIEDVVFDGVDMKINTRKNTIRVIGKWKRATRGKSVEIECEECREWLESNGSQ
ncbi:hypothetical protein MVEN_00071700 [Mycena venus]|uniref:Uncharacterized protein n=1 Tax=Mycena venus TaxID=2733690 RepID=A0A8H6Z4E7_9AGAR|nr:hypothetical protein MVEN_00071700 [Mycena venus]